MRLNISAWAIRKPIPSLVLFAVLMAAGWLSFSNLPVTNMPSIDAPFVSVAVSQAGAAPGELETQVARPVEAAVASLAGVKHISTTIGDGLSTTSIEFALETPVDRAVTDVRDAIAGLSGDLPETADVPVIERIDVEGGAIATYAVASRTKTPEELSWFVDDQVVRTLQGIGGVAEVRREGGVNREIRIFLDPVRLQAFDVTAAEVNGQLQRTNLDVAGGRGTFGNQEQSIRTLGGARTIEDLKVLPIILPGNRQVALGELGSISDGAGEARMAARLNSEPVIAFGIYRAKGHSDLAVADAAKRKLAELQAAHANIAISLIDTTVTNIQDDYDSAMNTLLEGTILAVIVVFLFLRDWRATLITSLAIPLSIVPSFFVIDMLGFSLNTISLLAITLVTGVLVDDAIVEIENIVRHMRMGKSAYRAAIEAADEIGLAVVATTATIVAVFVPVSFMGGIAGQYFRQFGITVAVAAAFSLLVARLVTPMLSAYFMGLHDLKERPDGLVLRAYTRILQWTIRWRFVTIAAGLAIFAGTIGLATLLPTGFLPDGDVSRATLNFELPPGITLAETERTTIAITALLRRAPEVTSVYATAGGSGSGAEIRKGSLTINLVPVSERSIDQKTFEARAEAALSDMPDLRFHFSAGNGEREFTMVLSGADSEAISRAALALETAIRKGVPHLRNVRATAALQRPEIRIVPKAAEAADLGVTVAQIAETVRIATMGDNPRKLAKFSENGRQIDIRVQVDKAARADVAMFEALRIRRDNGGSVPLVAVADIGLAQGPTAIDRYDRDRRIVLEGDLAEGAALGEALAAVSALPEARALPAGVTFRESGDAEAMAEVFSGFTLAMTSGLILVLVVLVLLFADMLQPVTILLSLPLSIGGALVALLATGHPMGIPAIIGFLMLMGIVTKNAILLVDFAIEAIAAGVDRTTALVDAGRQRARPIVMTTVAMSAGMLPSAIASGEGGAFRSPMAIAVIGGLVVSTLLSLVFVPAVFTVMDDLRHGLRFVFGRFVGAKDEVDEPGNGSTGTASSRP